MKLRECYVVNVLEKDAAGVRRSRSLMTLALSHGGRWLSSAAEARELAISILAEPVEFTLRQRRVLYLRGGSYLTAWHGGSEDWHPNRATRVVGEPTVRRSQTVSV